MKNGAPCLIDEIVPLSRTYEWSSPDYQASEQLEINREAKAKKMKEKGLQPGHR